MASVSIKVPLRCLVWDGGHLRHLNELCTDSLWGFCFHCGVICALSLRGSQILRGVVNITRRVVNIARCRSSTQATGGYVAVLRLFFAAGGCFVVSFVVPLPLSPLSLWGYKGIYIVR